MKKLSLIVLSVMIIFTACNSNNPEIITHFVVELSSSYATPLPGEVRQDSELEAARIHYMDKNVKYLVYCNFFDKGGSMNSLAEEDKNKEYHRLSSSGYDLYVAKVWSYKGKGEKNYRDEIMLLLTEEELETFQSNNDYGYFFGFIHNGDFSPIDFSECRKYNNTI